MNTIKLTDYLILLPAILSGCINGSGFSTAENIITRGWADVRDEDIRSKDPIYCYRTIGKVDCYATQIPGQESRLVTAYPPTMPHRNLGLIDLNYDDDLIEELEAKRMPPPSVPTTSDSQLSCPTINNSNAQATYISANSPTVTVDNSLKITSQPALKLDDQPLD